jgi:hypothetical protein
MECKVLLTQLIQLLQFVTISYGSQAYSFRLYSNMSKDLELKQMYLLNVFCHEFVVAVSSVACILGILILRVNSPKNQDNAQEIEENLLKMTFSYWLVYCVAFGMEKVILPHWEYLIMTLKITTALSYFLTFSCIVSLPLYKLAVHQVEE